MPSDEAILKKAPFARLLLALATGIIIQWYLNLHLLIWQIIFLTAFLTFISFFFLPLYTRFKFRVINGLLINMLFLSLGAMLVWHQDIRNRANWFAHFSLEKATMFITLDEDLIEKPKSFKAQATINFVFIEHQQPRAVAGTVLLYFSKEAVKSLYALKYRSQIIIQKPLQPIKSIGNPGGFDYARYALFQQITHQVYLNKGEFAIVSSGVLTANDRLFRFINTIRQKVLTILQTSIAGEKEKGLAEALLIGYKDDLDKTLVQSYTNTGVVHIIAISGLHVGLIYWLLLVVTKPLRGKTITRWLQSLVIIAGLWTFTLLAGAQPSILRSAVMFSAIILGENIGRRSSIYNSLATSAFLLLCYNPFWLWDIGFQLSYAALFSIVMFSKPIYNWFYVKNKLLDHIWKLNAVTMAAQLLTLPLTIYHFHQFPIYFLLTNFIAVPLSSLIVLGEIILCVIWFIHPLTIFFGKVVAGLIWFMNTYIERVEALPFSVWSSLQINIWQALFLFFLIIAIYYWLTCKKKSAFIIAIFFLLGIISLRSLSFIVAQYQQKIIVYNVPRQSAIEIVNGRRSVFISESSTPVSLASSIFYVNPTRILNRIVANDTFALANQSFSCLNYAGRRILILNKGVQLTNLSDKTPIDLLVLSQKATISIKSFAATFVIHQVIFDSSLPESKVTTWKKECDELHIPSFDVNEKGAFVMNLR